MTKLPRLTLLLTALLLACVAGCSTRPAAREPALLFPPPPELPRLQFLTSFSNSRQVEGEKGWQLIAAAGATEEKTRALVKPYGIAGHGGKLYVADTQTANIAVIDLPGKRFTNLSGNSGAGRLKKPINLATAADGTLYVADSERREVLCYDAEGNYLRAYGRDLALKPVDVAVIGDELFVLNFADSDIKVLDRKSGQLRGTIGKLSDNPVENLSLPNSLAATPEGALYISNVTSGQIIQLDRDGHYLASFGKLGTRPGQFGRPRGMAADAQGRVFIVDAAHQNVQIFDRDQRLLMFFGSKVGEKSMNLPAGIFVTRENLDFYRQFAAPGFELEQLVFVTNQSGLHKVAVYGMGKQADVDYEAFDAETLRLLEKKRGASETKDAK